MLNDIFIVVILSGIIGRYISSFILTILVQKKNLRLPPIVLYHIFPRLSILNGECIMVSARDGYHIKRSRSFIFILQFIPRNMRRGLCLSFTFVFSLCIKVFIFCTFLKGAIGTLHFSKVVILSVKNQVHLNSLMLQPSRDYLFSIAQVPRWLQVPGGIGPSYITMTVECD